MHGWNPVLFPGTDVYEGLYVSGRWDDSKGSASTSRRYKRVGIQCVRKTVIDLGLGLGPAQMSADGKVRSGMQQGLDLSWVKQRTSAEY